MVKRTGHPNAPSDPGVRFADAMSKWLEAYPGILDALVALRDFGDDAADALEAILDLKPVCRLRLSWELWAALAEGDGFDPEDILLGLMPLHVLERLRYALWGERPWRRELRVVPSGPVDTA